MVPGVPCIESGNWVMVPGVPCIESGKWVMVPGVPCIESGNSVGRRQLALLALCEQRNMQKALFRIELFWRESRLICSSHIQRC